VPIQQTIPSSIGLHLLVNRKRGRETGWRTRDTSDPWSKKSLFVMKVIRKSRRLAKPRNHGGPLKVKWPSYRPGVAQRVGRDIALLFHDLGTRRGWVINVTPRPYFTPGKDPLPIVQEAGWAPGSVWTDAENLTPTGIRSPDRPARAFKEVFLKRLCRPHLIWKREGRSKWSVTVPVII
jgi:hypothetical protein